ncbi:MAG: biotin transporter BioY [Clostridiales bacterium]|jgi:biotin transport system substrate-specific component|nr:biotin transporter BioY [Clostridiales bacterium]
MKTRDITLCSLGAAIIAVLSQFTIPLGSMVPFTLQTFAIPLVSTILGGKRAFFACLIYILIGIAGLPVFSNFSGGFQRLISPTGGFIISFPAMGYIIGHFSEKSNNYPFNLIICLFASAINLLSGMLFYKIITGSTYSASFIISVYPFIFSTAIKIIVSVYIAKLIKKNFLSFLE